MLSRLHKRSSYFWAWLTSRLNHLKSKTEKWKAHNAFDSLANFWPLQKRPDFAAHFSEQKARVQKTAAQWVEAETGIITQCSSCRIKTKYRFYTNAPCGVFRTPLIWIQPTTMFASCWPAAMLKVEATRWKEQYIWGRLKKQTVTTYACNLPLPFSRSKAASLIKPLYALIKCCIADSTYIEAYLHLADAYRQLGETPKTIEMLENILPRTNDATTRIEVAKVH